VRAYTGIPGTRLLRIPGVKRITFPLNHKITADDSLYGVRVRGDQRSDGAWDPCIEFESRRGIRMETCPPLTMQTVDALKEWAEGLDEPFLLDALAQASKDPIRTRRPGDVTQVT
jgi:hypothetical protein